MVAVIMVELVNYTTHTSRNKEKRQDFDMIQWSM